MGILGCPRHVSKVLTDCLVTCIAVVLVWTLLVQTNFLPDPTDTMMELYSSSPEKKQFVILLGGFRTGSTYLGELFNQNPRLLYIFEPFDVRHLLELRERGGIRDGHERSTLDELQVLWLQQLLDHCDTGDHILYPHLERYGKCGEPAENSNRFGSEACNETGAEFPRSELCMYRGTTVMKVNRLLQLQHLEWIKGMMEGRNVKIIHLLRDPRDVIRSRFKFERYYYKDRFPITLTTNLENKIGLAAEEWCIRQLDDIVYAERNPPSWLIGNYKTVTFPDLVTDPHSTARDLYTFLGLGPVPDSVTMWINDHPKVDLLQDDVTASPDTWTGNHTRLVEEECKPLIMKLGLEFVELDIEYSESYY